MFGKKMTKEERGWAAVEKARKIAAAGKAPQRKPDVKVVQCGTTQGVRREIERHLSRGYRLESQTAVRRALGTQTHYLTFIKEG